jgi:hypothetical protein
MIDFKKLCQDYHIPIFLSGKNVSPGWQNIRCPMGCGDKSNHMGFSPTGSFVCWRCGSAPFKKVLSRLLHIDENEISSVIRQYGGHVVHQPSQEQAVRIGSSKFKFPSNTDKMTERHKKYLESRGFDPDKLEREWGLLGTGPLSVLDNVNFKHRIVAPINWDNRIVSFQARDYTNRQTLRYLTCPPQREIILHKNILYGDQEKWQDKIIVVEGITDCWRFGPENSCAVFGIEFKITQVHEMKKHFEKMIVVFDKESQAQEQAEKLVWELRFRKVKAIKRTVDDDPASMTQNDADAFLRQIKF